MNMNHQIKMKVLEHLKDHMDRKMGQRLIPKKPLLEMHGGKGEENPLPDAMPEKVEGHIGQEHQAMASTHSPGPSEYGDEDRDRLMQLYSSLK